MGALLGLSGTTSYHDGSTDEVVFYKRILSANERAWLYNSGQGRSYADLSLPPSNPTTYHYDDPAHKHAVTSLSTGETYTYDANGNMICRVENGVTYKQDYNFENLLSAVHKMNGIYESGTVRETTQFVYDGDGNPSLSLRTSPALQGLQRSPPICLFEQLRMSPGANQPQTVPHNGMDQYPIRADVTIPRSLVFSLQGMVFVFLVKRLTLCKLGDHRLQLTQVPPLFFDPLVILFELRRVEDVSHQDSGSANNVATPSLHCRD